MKQRDIIFHLSCKENPQNELGSLIVTPVNNNKVSTGPLVFVLTSQRLRSDEIGRVDLVG